MDDAFEIARVFFATIGIVAFMTLVLFGLRKLTRRVTVNPGGSMRVIDRIGFGRESGLIVVSVRGKLLLIGISAQHTELLLELDITEEEYLARRENETVFPSFAQALQNFINRKSNNDEQ